MTVTHDVVLTAFRKCWLWDATTGRPGSVGDYQALFPDHGQAIALEYDRLASEYPSAADARAAEDARVGPYRIEEFLGRGGQGAVYAAIDSRDGTKVALKVLAAETGSSERRLQRLRREAEAVSRIDHPDICGIHEAGLDGEVPYLALRYVPGRTLADTIARARTAHPEALGTWRASAFLGLPQDGDDPTLRVAVFFERTARAVHAAHEAGLIHRDVKPGNLMVTPQGDPVVLDFGLARDEEEGRTITLTGAQLGTPAYMAPEQVAPDGRRLDRRVDVYALGLCLFEALTLLHPFEAPTSAAAARVALVGEARNLGDIDPRFSSDLALVVATALRRDPARRYRTALALAEDLHALTVGRRIRARPPSVTERLRDWARSRPAVAASVGVAFVTLSAGLAVSLALLAQTREAMHGRTAARDSATKSRASADALVEYMLGDLQRELAKVGRSDLLVATATKAKAHFDEMPMDELSDEERAIVADAWASLALAYESQARGEETFACRAKALAIREDLYARRPDVPAHARALADSLWASARPMSHTNRAEESIAMHRRAHDLLAALPAPLRDDIAVRSDDADIVRSVGTLLERVGRHEEALDWLRAAVSAHRRLERDAPESGDVLSRGTLAALDLASLVAPDEARRVLDDAVQSARVFVAAHPDDPFGQNALADVLARVCNSACDRCDGPAAEAAARDGCAIFAKLHELDPSNALWRNSGIQAKQRLCRALVLTGKFEDAIAAGKVASEAAAKVLVGRPANLHNPDMFRDVASVHRTYAWALRASGATEAALERLAESGRLLDAAIAGAPDDLAAETAFVGQRVEVAAALDDEAERANAPDRSARAATALDEGEAVLRRGLVSHPAASGLLRQNVLLLRERARICSSTGDTRGAVTALEEAVRLRDGLVAKDVPLGERVVGLDAVLASARAEAGRR